MMRERLFLRNLQYHSNGSKCYGRHYYFSCRVTCFHSTGYQLHFVNRTGAVPKNQIWFSMAHWSRQWVFLKLFWRRTTSMSGREEVCVHSILFIPSLLLPFHSVPFPVFHSTTFQKIPASMISSLPGLLKILLFFPSCGCHAVTLVTTPDASAPLALRALTLFMTRPNQFSRVSSLHLPKRGKGPGTGLQRRNQRAGRHFTSVPW